MLYRGSISSTKGSQSTVDYQAHLCCLVVAAFLPSTIILYWLV
jgi:hypothetical protein